MKTSEAGRAFIEGNEWVPFSSKCGWDALRRLYLPYLDYRGYETFGVGHLVRGTEDFSAGRTEQQVEDLFQRDLVRYESAVLEYVKVALSQNEFDALVDFTFNEGPLALDPRQNTFVRGLNAGDMQAPLLSTGLRAWDKSRPAKGGALVVDAGLKRRREAECHVWETPWPEDGLELEAALFDLQRVLWDSLPGAHA